MKLIFSIAAREFKSLFLSPLAWTLLAILQIVLAYLFLTQVETFITLQPKLATLEGTPGLTDIVVPPLFGNAGIILLLITPLLTMRLIAEERKQKTLTLLLSAPVSHLQIVLGKYLGLLGLMLIIVGLVTLMPLSLLTGGSLDLGKLAANALALTLLVSAFAACGLYMSCAAGQHPSIAATATVGFLLLLWLLNWTGVLQDERSVIMEYVSLLRHFQNLQTGLLGSVDIGYFLLFIASFLWLSVRNLDNDRLQQ
ncbi:hypothetical protein JCM14076_27610 [Methylosoma difficile]